MFVDMNPAFKEVPSYDRQELVSQSQKEEVTWIDADGEELSNDFILNPEVRNGQDFHG
jgi:hypothetical protein